MLALSDLGYAYVTPEGAFYLLLRAPDGNAVAFSDRAKREGLLIVPCDGFGLPGFVRLAYCVAPAVIRRAVTILERLRQDLQ